MMGIFTQFRNKNREQAKYKSNLRGWIRRMETSPRFY
jgi:hypothetical protein